MPDVCPWDGVRHRLGLINDTLQRIADAHAAFAKNVERLANLQATCGTLDQNRLYSRAETAHVLGVSQRTVDRRIRDGALTAIKTNKTVRIDGASLRRFRDGVQDVTARRVLKL